MAKDKPIEWQGSSLDDLLDFSDNARRDAGFQLHKLQNNEEPDDFKPFTEVGHGVYEIRLNYPTEQYRVMYVAKFEEAIYVLHAFQKKTKTTSKHDKDKAKKRYKAVMAKRRKRQ